MKVGIVGFSGSGKTTLFNALTGQKAPTGGAGGQKVNLGTIKVKDARVERLAEIDNPRKLTYAEILFADVPGGKGGRSLDSQTLGRIREMDALVQVARGFDDGTGAVDPVAELRSFDDELIIADLQIIEKRVERLTRDRSDPTQLKLLERCTAALENDTPLRCMSLSGEEEKTLSGFAFLSLKPLLLLLNVPEDQMNAPLPEAVATYASQKNTEVLVISGPIEAELATLEPEDQKEFLADLNLEEPASTRFVRYAFSMLNLISFLTHGPDECRAWPLAKGSSAWDAAGAIHSDIARGFIRAEVIPFKEFDRLKSEAACKEAGVFRVEGRDYIVQDGDLCHFRFNV